MPIHVLERHQFWNMGRTGLNQDAILPENESFIQVQYLITTGRQMGPINFFLKNCTSCLLKPWYILWFATQHDVVYMQIDVQAPVVIIFSAYCLQNSHANLQRAMM